MKIICDKGTIFSAVSAASHAVAVKSGISALEGILLRTGNGTVSFTGYNMETGITASVEAEVREAGECILPARLFSDIIRRLPEDSVTIEMDEGMHVVCRSGSARITFTASSAEDYPELPDVDGTVCNEMPRCELRRMISGTLFSASTNTARPIHTGCLFEVEKDSVTVVGVDGYRMAVRRWTPEGEMAHATKFVVPAPALKELERTLGDEDDVCSFAVSGKHLLFRFGGYELVCRTLAGEFLNWRQVLPQNSPLKLTAVCSRIQAAVERVGLVIQEEGRSSVRCVFGNNEVRMMTSTVIGSADDCCPLAGVGNDLEIGFNCRYLTEALRAVPDEEVTLELNGSLNPIVLTPCDGSGRFAYMVLPVRLKAGE